MVARFEGWPVYLYVRSGMGEGLGLLFYSGLLIARFSIFARGRSASTTLPSSDLPRLHICMRTLHSLRCGGLQLC